MQLCALVSPRRTHARTRKQTCSKDPAGPRRQEQIFKNDAQGVFLRRALPTAVDLPSRRDVRCLRCRHGVKCVAYGRWCVAYGPHVTLICRQRTSRSAGNARHAGPATAWNAPCTSFLKIRALGWSASKLVAAKVLSCGAERYTHRLSAYLEKRLRWSVSKIFVSVPPCSLRMVTVMAPSKHQKPRRDVRHVHARPRLRCYAHAAQWRQDPPPQMSRHSSSTTAPGCASFTACLAVRSSCVRQLWDFSRATATPLRPPLLLHSVLLLPPCLSR
jgi:hypothetical protein